MRSDLLNRRNLSYQINDWDDVNLIHKENYIDIDKQVIDFFINGSDLIYPAKTIFVAIVYSYCLNRYFNIDVFESLSDMELLPDDNYWSSYNYVTHKSMYDNLINKLGDIWLYESIDKTVNYFKKEYLIDGIDN